MVKPYQTDMDFAFFCVNFGYSLKDFEQLTPRQISFIYKAWEDKIVSDTTHMRNAVMNAIANAMRKKGKKFIDLWKKRRKKADMAVVYENLKLVREVEEKEGKSWVEKIFKENGLKLPKKGGR